MSTKQIALFVLGFIITAAVSSEEVATPGQFPPKEIQKKVRPLLKEVRAAQMAKNEKLVLSLAGQIVEHLGPWAANPNNVPKYHAQIKTHQPDEETVLALWRKINAKVKKNALWVEVPDGNPDKMKHGLRQAARPIIANAIMYNIDGFKTPNLLQFIKEGADYLLKLQRNNGLFPSPDLRGDDRHYTTYNKRALKKNPEALVEGWFVDDYRGELQFDHAVSGLAMLKAFQVTQDKKYLDSAIKAANWAISKELDTNWSYNAFSAWLLGETYQITGVQKYLFHAIEKLKLGVLPGLIDEGRWFDPINSRLIYHATNVRGMLAVYRNLEDNDLFKEVLRRKISIAVDNAARQIISNGASSATTSTVMLVEAMEIFGPNTEWQTALKINVNAAIDTSQKKGSTPIGVFLPRYIDYIKHSEQKNKQ